MKRLGDTYYENELLERSVTEKYGSDLKVAKVENTAAAIGTTENGKPLRTFQVSLPLFI